MPKDLAKTDDIREFIDLLAKNAPAEPKQAPRVIFIARPFQGRVGPRG